MITVQDERKTARSQEIDVNSFHEDSGSSDRTRKPVNETNVIQARSSEDRKDPNVEKAHERTRRLVCVTNTENVPDSSQTRSVHESDTFNVGDKTLPERTGRPVIDHDYLSHEKIMVNDTSSRLGNNNQQHTTNNTQSTTNNQRWLEPMWAVLEPFVSSGCKEFCLHKMSDGSVDPSLMAEWSSSTCRHRRTARSSTPMEWLELACVWRRRRSAELTNEAKCEMCIPQLVSAAVGLLVQFQKRAARPAADSCDADVTTDMEEKGDVKEMVVRSGGGVDPVGHRCK